MLKKKFPKSRIATIDVYEVGKSKHHVAALIEMDVTVSREKIKDYRKKTAKISFNAWLIKAIASTLKEHEAVTAFRKGKRHILIFNDINVSMVVEKKMSDTKVPIPLVIEKANEKSIEEISSEIKKAKEIDLNKGDVVLQQKATKMEKIYYLLPAFIRRCVWTFMLKNPELSFGKMGNVAITSIGMMGNVNGWFIPTSVHPVCFGISSITRKPRVVGDNIEIREVLNMTILLDHDVIDGAPMARFISNLTNNIEKGIGL